MGCVASNHKTHLSPQVEADLKEIFQKIDVDGSNNIDKEETRLYWYSPSFIPGRATSPN